MNDAEAKFTELVKRFEEATRNSVKDAITSIHSDLVPYLNDDTDANAIDLARSIVRQILSGNYELSEKGHIKVDGWIVATLDAGDHNKLVDKLSERCSNKALQLKVQRLERALAEAYRNY